MSPPSPPSIPSRNQPAPSTGLLVIVGPITESDVPVLISRLIAIIASSDAHVIACDVSALPPSAAAVEALARLQLTARRNNRRIRLQRASPCLVHLLDVVGLVDVVGAGAGSVSQGHRNAEQRKQALCVQKRVDRGDPPVDDV